MKYKLLSTLFIALLLTFCKKDKLEGDADILIGNWNWINTEQVTNTCGPDSLWNYSSLDSSSSDNNFSVEFLRKGKVHYYNNGNIMWRERIVFESINSVVSDSYLFEFTIYLNNNKKRCLSIFFQRYKKLLFFTNLRGLFCFNINELIEELLESMIFRSVYNEITDEWEEKLKNSIE